MGDTSYLQCKFCGRTASLTILKRDHGKLAPRCVGYRAQDKMDADGYRLAGQHAAVLSPAGLIKQVPVYVWWRDRVYRDEVIYHRSTGKEEVRQVFDHWGPQQDGVGYYPACPGWAWEMAKRLTLDKQLARRLGYVQKKRLVSNVGGEKVWGKCDIDKLLPVHVRVKILKVAASNEIARELIIDDPEAAAVIIRDSYGGL